MKKYLLSFAILLITGLAANAQFTIGVKGGVNFSKIATDNLSSSSVTGYQAGLFARIGSAFYLQPEVYLSSTGGKFSLTNNNTTANGTVTFTNINAPLLLGHSFGSKNLNFRLLAGPVYTYALSKNQSFADNFNGALTDFGKYNNSTIGYQAGGGVDIGALTVDLRYEGNLTKINPTYGQRQNLWALSVGFKFL